MQLGISNTLFPVADLFTVVDLETTGGSPANDAITEIGAVRVSRGRVEAEFQSLVNPGRPIAPFVSALTGITDAMVLRAPTIDVLLPELLEFATGSVLVAHNAPFDLGFLRAAASECDIDWPIFHVLDTVQLSRKVLCRGQVPNHRLGTLATYFGARTTPNHRALADAHATADVLISLMRLQRLQRLQRLTLGGTAVG